jgi:hypothetical protein
LISPGCTADGHRVALLANIGSARHRSRSRVRRRGSGSVPHRALLPGQNRGANGR